MKTSSFTVSFVNVFLRFFYGLQKGLNLFYTQIAMIFLQIVKMGFEEIFFVTPANSVI